MPEKQGPTVLKEGLQIQIQNIEVNGKACVPIFSSLDRLREVIDGEAGYLALNALQFFKMMRGSNVILNPGSTFGKEFLPEEIERILDGSMWKPAAHRFKKDTQVRIGQPLKYPQELVAALFRFLETRKNVQSAYLLQLDLLFSLFRSSRSTIWRLSVVS